MDKQEIDPFASPASLPFERRDGPIDYPAIPKLWKPPPSPVFLRVLAVVIPVGTCIGAQILLWANGQESGATLFETGLILIGEVIVLWFMFATRWAWLERKYAPTQHHYRKMLIAGFVVLIGLFFFLLMIMGRSSQDSRKDA